MMQADSTFSVLWLQSGGCGGCSMSLLCAESPDLYSWMQGFSIQLLWHPSLSDQADTNLFDIYERICQGELRLDALCLEGSILRGPNGSGRFHQLREKQSMADVVYQMALTLWRLGTVPRMAGLPLPVSIPPMPAACNMNMKLRVVYWESSIVHVPVGR
jgi:hypothetical protein